MKGKSPEGEPNPGADLLEGGQGLNQTGGSIAEPSLEQNWLNSPQTGSGKCSRIGLKTGPEQAPEQV